MNCFYAKIISFSPPEDSELNYWADAIQAFWQTMSVPFKVIESVISATSVALMASQVRWQNISLLPPTVSPHPSPSKARMLELHDVNISAAYYQQTVWKVFTALHVLCESLIPKGNEFIFLNIAGEIWQRTRWSLRSSDNRNGQNCPALVWQPCGIIKNWGCYWWQRCINQSLEQRFWVRMRSTYDFFSFYQISSNLYIWVMMWCWV